MSMPKGTTLIQDKLNSSRVTGEPTAFYPPIEPYNTGRLRVSELHELFYEEVGNPKGKTRRNGRNSLAKKVESILNSLQSVRSAELLFLYS